jgi:hypothetical protein
MRAHCLIAAAALSLLSNVGLAGDPPSGSRPEPARFPMKAERTSTVPQIRDGFPAPICVDPPTDEEVLRVMPREPQALPGFFETGREDIAIVKNKLVDEKCPFWYLPLIGVVQLHLCRWEYVVYYTEIIQFDFPISCKLVKQRNKTGYLNKFGFTFLICVYPISM